MYYSANLSSLTATYGYMDGEHAFSAAIILVMINIAFPYNARDRASMNQALEVLNGMAEKGNSHVRSLHSLLLNLCSTVGPVSQHTPNDQTTSSTPATGSGTGTAEAEVMAPSSTTFPNPDPQSHFDTQTQPQPQPPSQPDTHPHQPPIPAAAQAAPNPPTPLFPPPDNPFAAFLAAHQHQQQQSTPATSITPDGTTSIGPNSMVPEAFLGGFENPTADATLWEEGYGTFDMGMDFNWGQWSG